MTVNGRLSARDQAIHELRQADKLVVVAHENPDGDALGSLIGMQGILSAIGKDCLMFIAERDLPLPEEYNWFPLHELVSEPPPTSPSARSSSWTAATSSATPPWPSAARGRTSSTSTTTTTTPASAPSTSSCPRPRARPRSCGT